MKFTDIKIDMLLYDSWWPWDVICILSKTKNKIKCRTANGICYYDKPHMKYLRELK